MAKKIEAYTAQAQTGILLNANESSLNLSDQIMNEIAEAVPTIAFNRYPENEQTEIREAYAKVMGLQSEQLLAGNGSDQMLGLLIGTFLGKGKSLYTFDPDFSMYDYYASAYEANVIKYGLQDDGTLDVDAFIAEGLKDKVGLVMFSNPNNPSGHCLNIDAVMKIVAGFAPVPVVIDEAYFEFSDEVSALTKIESYENLYVTRTLSKAYSLAGIRLGFLASSQKNMDALRPTAVPYGLNSVSMKIGTIVLGHADEMKAKAEATKQRRNEMYEKVKALQSLTFWNSQANFLHGSCAHKDVLLKMFADKGIVIRNYNGKDTFRITIGTEEENAAVWEVLQQYEEEFA